MELAGRLHPLIVHFPIALVIVAAAAESVAIANGDARWRAVAVLNVRVAAVFAVMAAIAGWQLGSSVALTPLLEWHRWFGVTATVATVSAAVASVRFARRQSLLRWVYRVALFCAASSVAATGHSGGLLVWGADFLRF
jgi:uncharacterized membrane protein